MFITLILVIYFFSDKKSKDHTEKHEHISKNYNSVLIPPIFTYSEKDSYMISVLNILCRLDAFAQLSKIVGQKSPFIYEKEFFEGIVAIVTQNSQQNSRPVSFNTLRNNLFKLIGIRHIVSGIQNNAVAFLTRFIKILCCYDVKYELIRLNTTNNFNDTALLAQSLLVRSKNAVTSIFLKNSIFKGSDGLSHVLDEVSKYILNNPSLLFITVDKSSHDCYLRSEILNFKLCLKNDAIYDLVGIICYNGNNSFHSILIKDKENIFKQEIDSERLDNIKNIQNSRIAIYIRNKNKVPG